MDKYDLFLFFIDLRNNHSHEDIINLFNSEIYDINKLEINRIYRL